MSTTNWVIELFKTIDSKDADKFASFLTDDAVFKFANADPVNGKTNIRQAVSGFFASIKALKHELTDVLQSGDMVTTHGIVTYTRHDDSTLTVPFADLFKMDGDKVKEYLIFMDISELYKEQVTTK